VVTKLLPTLGFMQVVPDNVTSVNCKFKLTNNYQLLFLNSSNVKYVNLSSQMDFKIHDIQYFYIDILKQDLKLYHALVDEYHSGE